MPPIRTYRAVRHSGPTRAEAKMSERRRGTFTTNRKGYAMREFWLIVLAALLLLAGCATQGTVSPKQAKAQTDFYDCARDVGSRGASITNIVDTPDGGVSFKFKIDGGGEVSISQMKTLAACMRAKNYRVDGYR